MIRSKRSRWSSGIGLVGLAALLLAACGGSAAPTATPRPAPTAAPATAITAPATPTATLAPVPPTRAPAAPATSALPPGFRDFPEAKRGGVLNVGNTTIPAGWEPYRQISIGAHAQLHNMYDTLISHELGNYNNIVPQLARSWKGSPDGLTWTFELNRGVKFHDGAPFTAKDVAFTFNERLINQATKLPTPRGTLPVLKEVTAIDDYTVAFRLSQPYASFISGYLSYYRMAIYSKAWVEANGWERANQLPAAPYTGPFTLKEYVSGASAEMVRFPGYWVPGRPFLDGVRIFIIPDPGALLANFLTGQIHESQATPLEQLEMERRLGDKVVVQRGMGLVYTSNVYLHLTVPPMDDLRIRKAIAYAIDKEGFGKALGSAASQPGGFLFPGGGFSLPDAELRQYAGFDPDHQANLQKARALLAEAGVPKGFPVTYLARNVNTYVQHLIVAQSMLKEIGLIGEIKPIETAPYTDAMDSTKPDQTWWSIEASAASVNSADPNDMLESFQLPTGTRNGARLRDPLVVEMYLKQNATQDPAERKKLVQDIERRLLGLYHMVPTGWGSNNRATWAYVKNVRVIPDVQPGTHRDVWLEK